MTKTNLFVVVVSIDADYDDVGYPECMSIGYACDLDVALFHSWLQGVTSKSVKTSENSLLNPGGFFPRHCRQGDIRPGKGVKNCREDGYGGEGGGVLYGQGDRADSSRVLEASGREGLV